MSGVGAGPSSPREHTAPVTSFPKAKIKVLLVDGVHEKAVELFQAETFQVRRDLQRTPWSGWMLMWP